VQRRPPAKPLENYAEEYAERNDAIRAAFATDDYTLAQIADHFSVHYSTVSRIVKRRQK